MKKFLLFLIILCIGSITLLITGCEKELTNDKTGKESTLNADDVNYLLDGPNEGESWSYWFTNLKENQKQIYFSLVMSGVDTSTVVVSDHLRSYPFIVREWIYNNNDKEIHQMLEEMHDLYLIDIESSYYNWDYRMRNIPNCDQNERCYMKPGYTKEIIKSNWEMSEHDKKIINGTLLNFIKTVPYIDHKLHKGAAFYNDGTWGYNTQDLNVRSSYPSGVCYVTNVPFYSEWGSENPNNNWWCGHASLKCVGMAHGTYKSLTTIHNYFWNNSPGYSGDRCNNGKYCSSYEDLLIGAKGAGLYGHTTSSKDYMSSKALYCQKLMDGVWYGKPVIAASVYAIPAGHFYVITGFEVYYTSGTNIDYNASKFYLRDVNKNYEENPYWDRVATFQQFYDNRSSENLLVVRPWSYI